MQAKTNKQTYKIKRNKKKNNDQLKTKYSRNPNKIFMC